MCEWSRLFNFTMKKSTRKSQPKQKSYKSTNVSLKPKLTTSGNKSQKSTTNCHSPRKKYKKSIRPITTTTTSRSWLSIWLRPEKMTKWKSLLLFCGLIVTETSATLTVLYCTGKHMWPTKNLSRIFKTKSLSVLMPSSGPTSKATANLSSLVKWDTLLVEVPCYSVEEPS